MKTITHAARAAVLVAIFAGVHVMADDWSEGPSNCQVSFLKSGDYLSECNSASRYNGCYTNYLGQRPGCEDAIYATSILPPPGCTYVNPPGDITYSDYFDCVSTLPE